MANIQKAVLDILLINCYGKARSKPSPVNIYSHKSLGQPQLYLPARAQLQLTRKASQNEMPLYCTEHFCGPLDKWYDCRDCEKRGDMEEALMGIRAMRCPDYKKIKICDWCHSHSCWKGESQCSQPSSSSDSTVIR